MHGKCQIEAKTLFHHLQYRDDNLHCLVFIEHIFSITIFVYTLQTARTKASPRGNISFCLR